MALPRHRPVTLRELVRFDLTVGLPTAVAILRRRLSLGAALRVAGRALAGGLRDPLAGLSRGDWPADKERLVRHQLRTAVLLDDALAPERGLDERRRLALLADVVAGVGARFIPYIMPMPDAASWRAATDAERLDYVAGSPARFFNIELRNPAAREDAMSFDVCACRFVPLCRELGRPYLATLFCEADTVYFGRPESPVRLRRSQTIAGGAEHCDFRFEYDPGRQP